MQRMILCLTAAAAATAALGGCLEAEDDLVQFAEDFEHGLDLWGRTGETAIVTTNHPGEHAVWLAPGGSISHALQIVRTIDTDDNPYGEGFTDGNWIEYSGDCRGRPALTLEPATNPPGRDVVVRLVIEGPTAPDFFRSKHMFPALPAFVPQPDPDDPWNPQQVDVRFTSLVVAASAPCHVDNLRVMVSGGTLGY
ncbi:MAG TPA: hypothetical protein VM261_10995 [Kofleriaceae bacterium]|nr:hypothetical protein [Kofleriaceae bacterium]